jgi:hypothetical protein
MNSWRVAVQIWPVEVRNCKAVIHSSVVRAVSRAKSCKCSVNLLMRKRKRSSGPVRRQPIDRQGNGPPRVQGGVGGLREAENDYLGN